MTTAIKLDAEDIKKIIADHFHVDEKQVIKAQYSYIVDGVNLAETDDFKKMN